MMSLTPSSMMPLGTKAPEFELFDCVSGETISLQQAKGTQATVVMFICNHCPFVIHIEQELAKLGNEYRDSQVSIIAISSNSTISHPQDGPEHMKQKARQLGFSFPYLYDESQAIARAYGATCTPDFFLFDQQLQCVYRGQFDDSRPSNSIPVTGKDLRDAIENLLMNKPISTAQRPSIGCNIKWK